MTEKEKQEQLEIETLKRNSPAALPDNPSAAGWTSAQVKEKFYAGLLYLHSLISKDRTETAETNEGLNNSIEENKQNAQASDEAIIQALSEAITTVKNDILGGVETDYNTLSKIATLIEECNNNVSLNANNIDNLTLNKADKTYVNEKFNQLLGEGASETLDTIGEIAQALEENVEVVETLNNMVTTKADKQNVAQLENRVAYLEKTKPVTAGAVVNDTLVLFNAYIEDDTLVIIGGDIEDDTLVIGGN